MALNKFSGLFARRMRLLSVIVIVVISLSTPITYFYMSLHDEQVSAQRYAGDIAAKIEEFVQENPRYWQYSSHKFLELVKEYPRESEFKSLKVLDAQSKILHEERFFNHNSVLTPIILTAEIHYGGQKVGSVVVEEDIDHVGMISLGLLLLFSMVGGSVGWLIYYYPVKMVRRANRETALYQEHLEEMVDQRTESLQLANQEMESFVYSVSHDLRAPVRSINGFSQILIDEYHDKLDDEGLTYLKRVRTNAHKMDQLIEAMLHLARIGKTKLQMNTINISKIVELVIVDCREREPDRQIEVVIEPDLVIEGDRRLLRLLLTNLIDNAWKFTGKTLAPRIEFGQVAIDGENVFFIRDNGAGFNMEYAKKLFLPFERLHLERDYPGTGVGLAIVSRIVQRHGGRVWAEAVMDQGATFFFTI